MASFTFAPLTPTSFLARSAAVFGDRVAVVDGEIRLSYTELLDRSRRLAGALGGLGVERGDRVAALCTNSHVMLELHHGVPMRGAVLVPLNIRLSVEELTWIVEHSGAKVLVATPELAATAHEVADRVAVRLVLADGAEHGYDALLAAAAPTEPEVVPEQELLAINYTSGTTGSPKGVMYHHRGAFLQALAMAFHTRLDSDSRYLWTLPMFHCDGWCFPWAVTAAGGTHVCLRAMDPAEVWRLLREEGVTHFSAAPTVLTMIAHAPEAGGPPLAGRVAVTTGGAPPTPTLLARMADLGMDVTHLYGLTETFGPVAVNEWRTEWDELTGQEQATLRARQGVGNVIAPPLRVIGADGSDVPADGETIGEIVARGNAVMLGYYRDEKATAAVDADGWFRTGDLAVMHPDGYVEIRDRSKDIIISGGENISSVEVERVLDSHPDVVESAVVGRPDEQWGEVPVAFVVVRDGADPDAEALVAHVRERLAGFKAPKEVVFGDLPKTSTGKIQKNVLRRGLRG
jgi:fatty-acyl-CoA synthase